MKKRYDFTGGVRGKYACKLADTSDLLELRIFQSGLSMGTQGLSP